MLVEDGRTTLSSEWGAGAIDRPAGDTLVRLFESQVTRSPDAVAVVCGADEATYAELDHRAGQFADQLLARGVRPEDRVGLVMPRSVDLVATLLAVYKAGAVAVPMDPGDPMGRIESVLTDARPAVLVTTENLAARLPKVDVTTLIGGESTVFTRSVGPDDPSHRASEIPARTVSAESAACVLYPRDCSAPGVIVTYRTMLTLVRAMSDALCLNEQDRLLAVTSMSRAVTAVELLAALVRGATVHLADDEEMGDPRLLSDRVNTEWLTAMQASPTIWTELLFTTGTLVSELKIVVEGEPRRTPLMTELVERAQRVVAWYGPVEALWSSAHVAGSPSVMGVSAGALVGTTRVHLLDDSLEPVLDGRVGEVYVAGAAVARGYLGCPALTASRFVASPSVPGGRLYRTGDRAWWTGDGELRLVDEPGERGRDQDRRFESDWILLRPTLPIP